MSIFEKSRSKIIDFYEQCFFNLLARNDGLATTGIEEPFVTITMQPQKNPARVLLGLHGNSTEGLLL